MGEIPYRWIVVFQVWAVAVGEAKTIVSIDRRGSKLGYYIDNLVNFQALLYVVSDLHRLRRICRFRNDWIHGTVSSIAVFQYPLIEIAEQRKRLSLMKKSVVVISMIFLLLLVGVASADDTLYVTKQNYPMASTEEDLGMFHQSILNNDTAVFLELRQQGRAWMSKAGVEVYVVKDEGSGKIQIRPKNSTEIIWTLQDAVKKK